MMVLVVVVVAAVVAVVVHFHSGASASAGSVWKHDDCVKSQEDAADAVDAGEIAVAVGAGVVVML